MMAERVTAPQDPPPSGPDEWGRGPGVRYVFIVVWFSTKGTWSPALLNRATWPPQNLCGFSREAAAGAWGGLAEVGVCISLGFQPAVSPVSWLSTSTTQRQKRFARGSG